MPVHKLNNLLIISQIVSEPPITSVGLMTFGMWTSAVRVGYREDETLIRNVVGTD